MLFQFGSLLMTSQYFLALLVLFFVEGSDLCGEGVAVTHGVNHGSSFIVVMCEINAVSELCM